LKGLLEVYHALGAYEVVNQLTSLMESQVLPTSRDIEATIRRGMIYGYPGELTIKPASRFQTRDPQLQKLHKEILEVIPGIDNFTNLIAVQCVHAKRILEATHRYILDIDHDHSRFINLTLYPVYKPDNSDITLTGALHTYLHGIVSTQNNEKFRYSSDITPIDPRHRFSITPERLQAIRPNKQTASHTPLRHIDEQFIYELKYNFYSLFHNLSLTEAQLEQEARARIDRFTLIPLPQLVSRQNISPTTRFVHLIEHLQQMIESKVSLKTNQKEIHAILNHIISTDGNTYIKSRSDKVSIQNEKAFKQYFGDISENFIELLDLAYKLRNMIDLL